MKGQADGRAEIAISGLSSSPRAGEGSGRKPVVSKLYLHSAQESTTKCSKTSAAFEEDETTKKRQFFGQGSHTEAREAGG